MKQEICSLIDEFKESIFKILVGIKYLIKFVSFLFLYIFCKLLEEFFKSSVSYEKNMVLEILHF